MTDFVSGGTEMYDTPPILPFPAHTVYILQHSNSKVQTLRCHQTPFNRIEVTVDTSYEHHRMFRTSQHGPYIQSEERPCEKSHGCEPLEDQIGRVRARRL